MARTKSIGVWIRRNREQNGFSQKKVAKTLGYSAPTIISLWENGKSKPDAPSLKKLEKLFGPFKVTSASEPETDIGNWLRTERTDRGLTLMQLSAQCGINISTLSQIENGKIGSPSDLIKEKLDKVFGAGNALRAEKVVTKGQAAGIGDFQEFNPYVDSERPKVAGIYVFYDVSERPIYVGEGGVIRNRIKDHEEKFWFKPPIVETAAFIEVRDEALRVRIEKMLIRFLKSNAVINKQHVDR